MDKTRAVVNFADKLVRQARKNYEASDELRFYVFADEQRITVKFYFWDTMVFEVGLLGTADPKRFFKLTKIEAAEALRNFFQVEGGKAA